MRLRPITIAAALVTSAALAVPLSQSAVADPTNLLSVTQNVLPGLANATDTGAAAAGTPLSLVFTLARPDAEGERALVTAEHTPGNPQFGHYLSPAEFAARFGVPQQKRDAVRAFLTGGGLAVDSVSTAGDVVSAHGDAAHVSALLRTPLRTFTAGGTAFLANTGAPVTPYALGITNIAGLNTLQRYSTPSKPVTRQQGTCAGATCIGGTTPADLWSVYQQPAAHTGKGQQLAVFGEGQSDDVISDLRMFEQKFALPQIPVTVKHPAGDTDFSDDAGRAEWDIDTQASSGMAPDADGLTLYFGSDLSDADVTRVFTQFTDDPSGPMQASASYGECETIPVVSPIAGLPALNPSLPVGQGLGNNNDATLDQVTRQAAAEGKTIFVSTGDTGSSCPVVFAAVIGAGNGVLNQGVPVTNSPASLPYVVGVGGTVLYTDGKGARAREYGWTFGGGGNTLFTPRPDYQAGTPNLNLPCVTAVTVCRGIADVSAQSGDVLGNGYDIVLAGSYTEGGGGGTSLSSPLWEGMWTRVQSAANSAQGNGFANYPLYRAGRGANYARDYFDVSPTDLTTSIPSGNGLYTTLPNWDYVTGWGTPKVAGLICDIDHSGC